MSVLFVPLRASHVPAISLQVSQQGAMGLWTPEMTEAYGHELVAGGPAWAGIDVATGRVIGAAGFAVVFPTHANAWALLSPDIGRHAKAITQFVRLQIGMAPWRRIEALTRAIYPQQARWAKACGFSSVAVMRNHGPLCETVELFEVVRDGI
ncbi:MULTISPECIES: hypothetical protein [Novosphingobium]|uniref:hypothetical protein n=1 Tax=Novosphingobium TaxID=165696 RepID=UPI000D316E71|nr:MULTISPECIES: hypothetical protein [Novosphingobium]PTR07866.1 hypothetical protein C8K11_11377 [Novosphingobium sp. GV055]PUB00679.1 hypothetical protein C8K12_11377 [Novosphingobium sp. GV061]PUB16088.1 hypothetical protein C8K14_11377 [Novosphingobium sp. GV079]PUB39553.1 hypothetical protein C8K10_11377 [Novosphingobium sp. GV027]WQD93777.1 hypothetical protein U0041_04040 [Novosphingobium capsulatum]